MLNNKPVISPYVDLKFQEELNQLSKNGYPIAKNVTAAKGLGAISHPRAISVVNKDDIFNEYCSKIGEEISDNGKITILKNTHSIEALLDDVTTHIKPNVKIVQPSEALLLCTAKTTEKVGTSAININTEIDEPTERLSAPIDTIEDLMQGFFPKETTSAKSVQPETFESNEVELFVHKTILNNTKLDSGSQFYENTISLNEFENELPLSIKNFA